MLCHQMDVITIKGMPQRFLDYERRAEIQRISDALKESTGSLFGAGISTDRTFVFVSNDIHAANQRSIVTEWVGLDSRSYRTKEMLDRIAEEVVTTLAKMIPNGWDMIVCFASLRGSTTESFHHVRNTNTR